MKKTIIFLFFSILQSYSQSDKIQFLNAQKAEFDIVSNMMFVEDTSSKMTIDDIILAKQSNKLIKSHGNLSFGLSNSVFWLYFKFQNKGNDSTLILRLQDPGIDMIHVYNSNKLIDSLGDDLPFYNRKIIDKDFAIRIPSKQYLIYDYYIRVEKKGQTLSIPIQLFKENLYQQRQKDEYLFWGLFWGVTIALILLNLITFFNFREKVFLFSCAYIFFFATFCTTGLGYEYIWYNYPIYTVPQF